MQQQAGSCGRRHPAAHRTVTPRRSLRWRVGLLVSSQKCLACMRMMLEGFLKQCGEHLLVAVSPW